MLAVWFSWVGIGGEKDKRGVQKEKGEMEKWGRGCRGIRTEGLNGTCQGVINEALCPSIPHPVTHTQGINLHRALVRSDPTTHSHRHTRAHTHTIFLIGLDLGVCVCVGECGVV